MAEKLFPTILNDVVFINTKHKPSREEIIKQMMCQEPLISDEEAFLRHLIRKWGE